MDDLACGKGVDMKFTLALVCGMTWAQGPQFLTPPSNEEPTSIMENYLQSNRTQMRLSDTDLAGMVLKDLTRDEKGQVTHLYYYQNHEGIEVVNAIINGNITAKGQLVLVGNHFITDLANKINTLQPKIPAEEALYSIATDLNLAEPDWVQIVASSGSDRYSIFQAGELSMDTIPIRLKLYPQGENEVRLAWCAVVRPPNSSDWWEILVDTENAQVLKRFNWTVHDSWTGSAAGTDQIPADRQMTPEQLGVEDGSSYYVVPEPFESPNHGSLELVNTPADATGSPFGWHDTNGATGPEFTITRGNNVHAFQDRDGNDVTGGDEPDGGGSLTFNIVPDFGLEPVSYSDAATVNLFYWNNVVHDLLYLHGFDAPSGNFQQNNYSMGGTGNDYVRALAQAGADLSPPSLNNANFSTPPEGSTPRMRMYEWTGPATLTVLSPQVIAGDYIAGSASFGPLLDSIGLTGELELVNDGGAIPSEGCGTLIGFTPGKIAVIDRGSCEFGLKVLNAEQAGAIGAIVINNQGDGVMAMGAGAVGSQVTIPSLFIGQTHGGLIKAQLGNTVTATIKSLYPKRDSDYDSGIIAHEYGHGVSNRLTGGPSNTSCLGNTEQAGEGWSDFFALAYTATPGAQGTDPKGVGTYASFQPLDGPGIRQYPYSTDMAVNPVTYDKLKDPAIAIPHGVGHVWNSMLWELYWGLIDQYGFDADLYNGTGGNNICIRLVIEGLKQQVCSPSFVQARDGILAADLALYGGANTCIIWKAFAKRGLGVSANAGSSSSITDGTEAFDVPEGCNCLTTSISDQPSGGDFCESDETTITVVAQGDNLTYQWKKDTVDIDGETLSTLVLSNLIVADSGSYTCVVTGDCGEETTDEAVINVSAELVFGNSILPSWYQDFPEPGCGDVNQNQMYDILDFIQALPVIGKR